MFMKRLLFIEEDYLVADLRPILESFAYEVIGISNENFIEEAIRRHEVDAIVISKEMRIGGESLALSMRTQSNLPLAKHLLKLKDTKIDFNWGIQLARRIKNAGIKLPMLCLTTDEIPRMEWYYQLEGVLFHAVIPKNESFHLNLITALKKILGPQREDSSNKA